MSTEATKKLLKKLDLIIEEDRKKIEEMTSFQMKTLADSLRNRMKHILDSASADVTALHKQFMVYISHTNARGVDLQKGIKKRTIVDRVCLSAIVVCIFLGVFFGFFSVTRYMSGAFIGNAIELQQLESKIVERQKTLDSLEQKTWGVEFIVDNQGKWILLPVGMSVEKGEYGQQVALKLVPKAQ